MCAPFCVSRGLGVFRCGVFFSFGESLQTLVANSAPGHGGRRGFWVPTHAAWEGVGVRPVISPPTPTYRLDEIGSASHGDARARLGLQARQGPLVLQFRRHTFYVAAPPDAVQGQLPSAQSQVASKLPESSHRGGVFSSSMAPRWQSGSHDWGGALCRVFLVTYCPC